MPKKRVKKMKKNERTGDIALAKKEYVRNKNKNGKHGEDRRMKSAGGGGEKQ